MLVFIKVYVLSPSLQYLHVNAFVLIDSFEMENKHNPSPVLRGLVGESTVLLQADIQLTSQKILSSFQYCKQANKSKNWLKYLHTIPCKNLYVYAVM